MKLKEPILCKIRKVRVFDGETVAKVAVTGDWHISPIVSDRQLKMLETAFSKIRPELIILEGDLMDSPEQFKSEESVKKLKRWFVSCKTFAPTVMVLGSHDYIVPGDTGTIDENAHLNWEKICLETGVKLLNDEWFETEHIRVFGMYQGPDYVLTPEKRHVNNPKVFERKLMELGDLLKKDDTKLNWFVAHAPDMTEKAEKILAENFEVASFGHTHGGCLPLVIDTVVDKVGRHGGLVSPTIKPFPSNVRGVRKINGLTFIINAGMVATQNCAPKATQYLNFAKAAEITEVIIGKKHLLCLSLSLAELLA